MYYWKNYICEPSNIRIEVSDVVHNQLTFHIYRDESTVYSRKYKFTDKLQQESLDKLVGRLCNIFTKFIGRKDDIFATSTANELKKVWNKGGLLIWDRSKKWKRED